MPLPKPKPTESRNQFLSRCMADETSMTEYPDVEQRYAVCNSLLSNKKYILKQAKKKIALNFRKQIILAEKKNYPIAYNYYLKEFEKASKMFIENPIVNNQNFNVLFSEIETKKMYSEMYKQTGLRFAKWYANIFEKLAKKQLSTSVIEQNMERYATEKENYLALVREVSAVSGVAKSTLKKVLAELLADETFMSLGEEARVREIMKRLKFKARWMARRIVRTETTASANFGIQLSASDIYGDDNLVKEWIAFDGPRTRDTHRSASSEYSNNPIPMNEPYFVGGSKMMFPSDTSLGAKAKEVVNCRCVSIPFIPD
tara:strand:+ start:1127 stop:2071 length:945 start_codon:yes stop_codon:yes gene_type:complete